MNTSVYTINKGIGRPVEFKGLKAQYIGYLAVGLVALLLLFAILYIAGLNTFVCLLLILVLGSLLFSYVYRLSHTYGPYGMMKKMARRSIPHCIKNDSRKTFTRLAWKKN